MTLIFLALSRIMDKEKFLAYAKYYTIFKIVFNAIVFMCIASLVSSSYGMSDFTLPLIFSLFYYPYTILETYFVVRKVNKYRNVIYWVGDFIRHWSIAIIINTATISLIIVLIKELESEQFMFVLYLLIVTFPWLQTYTSSMAQQGVKIEAYSKILSEQYNVKSNMEMYIYNGKFNKEANMYVKGILSKKRIMISDYLITNLTEEEVCTILCHEISHCVNYDTEVSVLIVNAISLILVSMGYLFEVSNMPITQGIFITIAVIISLALILMAIRRAQEYKADRYVVDIIGDYVVFGNALQKICELNDTMKKRGTLLSLLETHPQYDQRILKLKDYCSKKRSCL